MIRILVVEDSPTVRELLINLLEADAEIQVVGQAVNGGEAVKMVAQLRPDLVTMDVVMPDMDGLEATRKIMRSCPTPILIVTAHADSSELNVAFEAIEAGALDVVPKPGGFGEENRDWEKDFLDKVKNLAAVKVKALK